MSPRLGATAALLAVVVAVVVGGCAVGSTQDGYQTVAEGDTYGEWALEAEFEDGEWTGCLRMSYDDDGPRCADPDEPFVRFEDWTGAQYGAVEPGGRVEDADGEPVPLLDDRFFVVIEGPEVRPSS